LSGKEKTVTIINVNTKDELTRILKAYCNKTTNSNVVYENFVGFLEKFLEKHGNEAPGLFVERSNLRPVLDSLVYELRQDGLCNLQILEDKIQLINYVGYFIDKVEKEYQKIQTRTEIPFPSEESLALALNSEMVEEIDVKQSFVQFLGKKNRKTVILRLVFPDIPKTVVVTSGIVVRGLLECSLLKIKNYLRSSKNAIYIQHKLLPSFRQKEGILKDMIVNTVTKPDLTVQDLLTPSDLVFQFWTQLSSLLLKEYIPKKDKLEEELDLCYAAYLIGYYAVFNKNKLQKEKESEFAFRVLQASLDKPPYAFTFHDIYNLKDTKGLPIINKLDKDRLNQFFDERTKPKDKVSLPDLIKVKTSNKKEYFIRREHVLKVIMERIGRLANDMKEHYVSAWTANLLNDKKSPEMEDNAKFDEDIGRNIDERDPLFFALLNFNLIFLIREQVQLSSIEIDFINGLLDKKNKTLTSLSELLHLERKDIYHIARLKLPMWKVIPGLNIIFSFINRILFGSGKPSEPNKKKKTVQETGFIKEKAEASSSSAASADEDRAEATKRVQKAKYKEAIAALRDHYLEDRDDMKKRLSDLANLWNPLIDQTAKANLIEDVNSLVRDYLRKLKFVAKLHAPDAAKIESLSSELSKNEVLSRIRDKEHLREYIALYMLEVLDRV